MATGVWIFGYGSLIWKVGFEYEERREGYIEGWTRRFWQQSEDHRGTPEAPGRVVTLVEERGARCWGAAYRVAPAAFADVLEHLDYREKGGYARHVVPVYDRADALVAPRAVTYVGVPGNPNWGGPLPLAEIARIVTHAVGPSGTNLDYVTRLHDELVLMGANDEHVQAVYAHCAALEFASPDEDF